MSSGEGNKKTYTSVNPDHLPSREAVKVWLEVGGYLSRGISFCTEVETGGHWDNWAGGVRGEHAWVDGTTITGVEIIKGKRALKILKGLGYLLTDISNPGDGIHFSSDGPIELKNGKWTSTKHVVKDRKYTTYKKAGKMYGEQWYLYYGSLFEGHRMFFWKEIRAPTRSVQVHVPVTRQVVDSKTVKDPYPVSTALPAGTNVETKADYPVSRPMGEDYPVSRPMVKTKDSKHVETKTSKVKKDVSDDDLWLVAQRMLVQGKTKMQLRELMLYQLTTASGPEKEKLADFWLSSEVPRV